MALTTSDGSKSKYTYRIEAASAPGTPVAGAYQLLRSKVGVKFDLKRDTFMSKDRRADRMESSMTYGNKSGSGSIPIEWSYGTFEDIMAAVLGDDNADGTTGWTGNVLKIGNTTSTYTFEETSNELGITEQIVGVQFSGFTISQKVNAIAEGSLDFAFRGVNLMATSGVRANETWTFAGTGPFTVTRGGAGAGDFIADGFTNGDKVWFVGCPDANNNRTPLTPWTLTGLSATVMTFTTATGFTTGVYSNSNLRANEVGAATSEAATTTIAPFDSFTGSIYEGGTAAGNLIAHVTGWDLKVEQAIQPNFVCGQDTPASISVGTIKVSGNLTVYYIDQALRKKFINGTPTSLRLILGSVAATKAYTFDLGTVKYTSHTRDDNELARTESMAFAATYTASDTTIKITRTP